MTTMTLNTSPSVNTTSGGDVNLHNVVSITSSSGQTVNLNASSGTINVSNLGGGANNSGVGSATLSNSGTVLWGSPTSLKTFSLTITGTGNTIDVSHVAAATDLNLNASGGAQIALPALTQLTENNGSYGSLQASSGGEVNLHNVLSITSSSGQTVSLNASGGTIDLSSLGSWTGSGISATLSNSGAVLWGNPTSLSKVSLTVTGTGNTINLSQAATAANLSLTAAGGAQVVLPALTQIAENAYAYGSLQANGANSLLDLSHVTTLEVDDIFTGVQASSGGEVNLHNLLSITSSSGQTPSFNASGGTINVLEPGARDRQQRRERGAFQLRQRAVGQPHEPQQSRPYGDGHGQHDQS